jgi:DNA-directed RNA polymerase subunit RPC12/RpoP
MDNKLSVDLLCLSCQQQLRGEKNKAYRSGDQIKCESCGELNDYDQIIEVAQKKAIELVKSRANGELTITIDKPSEE